MSNDFRKFKKAPLLFSVIFFMLACAIFVFLHDKTEENNQVSELKENEWRIEASRKDEIASLERSLKATEQERANIDTHFIHSSNIVPFLDAVEHLAPEVSAHAEVTLVDLPSDNTSLNVGVTATGTFPNLFKFLTLIENSPYRLELTFVDIRRSSEIPALGRDTVTPEWSMTLKIKLLSFLK